LFSPDIINQQLFQLKSDDCALFMKSITLLCSNCRRYLQGSDRCLTQLWKRKPLLPTTAAAAAAAAAAVVAGSADQLSQLLYVFGLGCIIQNAEQICQKTY
jgi:hypothetical protein